MSLTYFTEARSKHDVDEAQRLRYEILARELGIPLAFDPLLERDVSSFDNLSSSHHVLVYRSGELVATARLSLANRSVAEASGTRFGFELEREFVLDALAPLGTGLAEVARVAVRHDARRSGAAVKLYEALHALSRELGVEYWVGAVDCQTSGRRNAMTMFRRLREQGLLSTEYAVAPRDLGPDGCGFTAVRAVPRLLGVDSECDETSDSEGTLSTTITAFARGLGARALGEPARHPGFPGRFVLPMLAELDAIPAKTAAHFDPSSIAPPLLVASAS